MTKKTTTKMVLAFVLSVFIYTNTVAQAQVFKIDPKTSTITILGTSNLHDWESKAKNFTGEFGVNANKQVQAMTIKIPVKSIKSGKGMMDDLTYETFNSDKNPLIVFQLSEVASPVLTADKEVHVLLTGNLTMNGVSRKISFKAVGKPIANGGYKFSATLPVKMSDYKMIAPKAMFGTMKVGDGVTLKFDIVLIA